MRLKKRKLFLTNLIFIIKLTPIGILHLLLKRMYAYQWVRNVSFSGDFAHALNG